VELRDLRRPPGGLDCTTGANLEVDASIVLTVGSDCAVGKMTVALELDRAARARGLASVFVPTGQTGIAIAGWGIAVDAVVSDFLGGAAEELVLEGRRRGGELLWVEGQGSLVHPAYSGVTLGLFHGSVPHVLVLCHKARAREIEGSPGHPIPPLADLVALHEQMSLPRRRARVAALAVNTAGLDARDARAAVSEAAGEAGLPAFDAVRDGADELLDVVLTSLG
jgi:D-glutamate N-acetyltransferase